MANVKKRTIFSFLEKLFQANVLDHESAVKLALTAAQVKIFFANP